jgi:hypothetical protein
VCLVSGSECKGDYATLSHCWGSKQIITATRQSIAAFRTNVPWDQLSKTFQDAILISQALGLSYLWIDSLCIIQDDQEDWELESAAMSQVYLCAFLNITASAASEGSIGCFILRAPQVQLDYLNPNGSPSGLFAIGPRPRSFAEDVLSGPLIRRGWVVQERILSRRRLYYAIDQLHWQCSEIAESEYVMATHELQQDWKNSTALIMNRVASKNDITMMNAAWHKMIEDYTMCSLTIEDDKLPAMSGLASCFAASTGYQYAAGLWKETMPAGLLWGVSNRGMCKRPLGYRAPSWSWASIDSAVYYGMSENWTGNDLSKYEISQINVNVQLGGTNPFGKVTWASLEIEGIILWPVLVDIPRDQLETYWSLGNMTGNNLLFRTGSEIATGHGYFDEAKDPGQHVACLRVGRQCTNGSRDPDVLILQPTGGENEYRRLGIGRLFFNHLAQGRKVKIVII